MLSYTPVHYFTNARQLDLQDHEIMQACKPILLCFERERVLNRSASCEELLAALGVMAVILFF